jgi:hypothetical protein
MLTHLTTAIVCTAYVTYIEYGDSSALSDYEIKLADAWLSMLPHPNSLHYHDESEFARDEITGLMADCINIDIYANNTD